MNVRDMHHGLPEHYTVSSPTRYCVQVNHTLCADEPYSGLKWTYIMSGFTLRSVEVNPASCKAEPVSFPIGNSCGRYEHNVWLK